MSNDSKITGNKLSMKHDLFCRNYTAIGTDTFQIGSRSYEAAGFHNKFPETAASRLLSKVLIQARIHELYAEQVNIGHLTPEYVVANIRNIKERAFEKNDLTNALAAVKLEGQMLSLFSIRHVITPEKVAVLSDDERVKLEQVARDFKLQLAQGVAVPVLPPVKQIESFVVDTEPKEGVN